jgi:hypothetical protein
MIWKAKASDIIDHLVYSGADTYEWYHELTETKDGQIVCTMETGEYDDESEPLTASVAFSPTHALTVANAIIKGQEAGWRTVQSAVANDDFDSDAADIVLQHIVLSDLVFG